MSAAQTTTSHEKIRRWVEERSGHPSRVKGAKEGGILRIDFGEPEQSLEEISWQDFFRAFLYREKTKSGDVSLFTKFVRRH